MALPPESHRLEPDHLPTPFSASQIHAASTTGRLIRIRSDDFESEPTYRQILYLETDADGATQAFTPTDAAGQPIGASVERRSTWLELQQHASKPAASTTVTEADLELGWGIEPCWTYAVREGEEETCFWFAKRLPGMPVLIEVRRGGRVVNRSEVTSRDVVGRS